MSRARKQRLLATAATIAVLVAAWGVMRSPSSALPSRTEAEGKSGNRTRAPEKPVTMAPNMVQLRVSLGLKNKAKKPEVWDGKVSVSQGRIHSVEMLQGNVKGKILGTSWMVRSVRKMRGKQLLRPIVSVSLTAPPTAKVTFKTAQGTFSFVLGKLIEGKKRFFLNGRAAVERQTGATRFTRPETEDDYPALARAADGTVWLAYNEYQPGPKLIKERVLAGNFELLVPTGNGDQVRLKRFDGKTWHPSLAVTPPGLNIWRPTVAVAGNGDVVVAWAQQIDGDWEVCYRTYSPSKKQWSKIVRLSNNKGSDFHVVAATDSKGVVWLAWQSWRGKQFDIVAAALAEDHRWAKPAVIADDTGNSWSPSIATDSQGGVHIVWDAYDGDSYNVHLASIAGGKTTHRIIAGSPRFEARPAVVCDPDDRVWIAYEEGDEQWGKDYATAQILKIDDVPRNPGNGLYLRRTIQVRCLANGKLLQPKADLQAAFGKTLPRNKSLPRLATDADGGVWLWCRHHPSAGGGGEIWASFALRYDGSSWSSPRRIANSEDLLDNRPALVSYKSGILAVYTSDQRKRSANRKQNDLYALYLPGGKATGKMELVAATTSPQRKVKPVHPKEAEHVARIRSYRIDYKGKKLRLFRGEFHRHTEYTAHRDQDGLFEDSWRYALDAGMLDWMGNGDHDNGFGYEYPWWQIQKYCDIMNHPPVFQAALTYERSNRFPNGHRNVIMPVRGIRPLPRGNLKGTPQTGTPDTKMLYAYLKHFGGICASHTSGTNMGTDWRDNDPVAEPIVEIYQGHRHNYEHYGAPRSPNEKKQIGGYQPSGFVWNAFKKGYRMGFQASSDHVSTHMSYAVVLTDDVSRKGLIEAFKQRHCYAATDNIILEVRSGEHLMGDIFTTQKRPTLQIKVLGTAPIAKLHIVRNNEYLHSFQPNKTEVNMTFVDMRPLEGKEAYYYVRVEQADKNLAWASPMWITYRPK